MVEIKHVDVAPLAGDELLGAAEWNKAHSIELSTTARVLGRTTAGGGAAEELSAGTGISFTGGEVVNTAPDQTVVLTGGTGISTTGTYPNFTITNDAPMVFPASGIAVSTGSAWTTSLAIATDANIRAGASNTLVPADNIYSSNAPVTSSGSGSHALNFNNGRVFQRTLTGNSTLANPSNQVAGQSGIIYIIQDGTGGRTLSLGANWKPVDGAPDIDTGANKVNVFSYYVRSSGNITLTYLGAE